MVIVSAELKTKKPMIFSSLSRLPAKGMLVALTCMHVPRQTIDAWTVRFWTFFSFQPVVRARSAQLCRFAPLAPLLSLRSASSWSITQPTDIPIANFVLLWTSVGFKNRAGRFRMVRHKPSWLLPLLEVACPALLFLHIFSLPCADVLVWVSVQYVALFQPLSMTGGFALLVALRPNFFIVTLARNRVNDQGRDPVRKGEDLF